MEVEVSSTTGSRNPSPSLPEEAKVFDDGKAQENGEATSHQIPDGSDTLSTTEKGRGLTAIVKKSYDVKCTNSMSLSLNTTTDTSTCEIALISSSETSRNGDCGTINQDGASVQCRNEDGNNCDHVYSSMAVDTIHVGDGSHRGRVSGEAVSVLSDSTLNGEGNVSGEAVNVRSDSTLNGEGNMSGESVSVSGDSTLNAESLEGSVPGEAVSVSGDSVLNSGSREGSVPGEAMSVSGDSVLNGRSHEGSVLGEAVSVGGDSVSNGGSREGSVSGDSCESSGVVTETMLEEEQRLLERESRSGSTEVPDDVEDLRNMVEHQRYNRLLHLLQRSTIYSKFLLKRMEGQQEADKKDKKKQDETKKKSSDETTSSPPSATPVTPGRVTRSLAAGVSPSMTPAGEPSGKKKRGRKRKASAGSFKISDYMDSQGKLKKMKMDKAGEEEAPVLMPSLKKKKQVTKQIKEIQRHYEGQPISPRQPALLTGGVMRSYQLDGMDWIKVLYENGVNGILGDEMGLGKTIQSISVIAYMIGRGVKGPFLVAAPLSTVPNWVSEFKRFAPRIPVVLYHGSMSEREQLRKTMFKTRKQIAQREKNIKNKRQPKRPKHLESNILEDVQSVVVTSYEICMRDQKYLQDRNWKFLVVDEGHRIKNLNCKLIRTLKSYDAANRLLLTGTPLQNNLAELWSLLNFLLPDIFDDLNSFQSWFDFDMAGDDQVKEKIIAQEREQHVLRTLHQILTPFLLRRLKCDVEYSLPPKKEILVYAPLTAHQEKFYKSLLDKSIFELLEKEKKDKMAELFPSVYGEGMDECAVEGEGKKTSRNSRKTKADYSQLTDEQFDSIMMGDAALDDFIPQEKVTVEKQEPIVHVSATNIKMTSVWTMLRKVSNHPYLIEFPLTKEGEFRIDEDLVQCCGKTKVLDRLVPALVRDGHKILIFSQFTTMLDILEDYMEMKNIRYSRLDGSMPFADRQIHMTKFKSDPKCMVFLLSTRAAGLGLNLTAADTVIIYDSDWNPQSDLQAQDRCHRIGQSKPVIVYRLVTSNTIDQCIVERAASKRKLEKMIIHKGKFKGKVSDNEISLDDLSELLHSVDHDKFVNSDGKVISDKALSALLDRSFAKKREESNVPDTTKEGESDGQAGVYKVLEEIGNVVCNKTEVADDTAANIETEESPCSVEIDTCTIPNTEEKMECDENTHCADVSPSKPDNMETEGRSSEQVTVSVSS